MTYSIVGSVDDYQALFLAGALLPDSLPAFVTHSVAELGELLTAKDYEIQQIEAAFAGLDKSGIAPAALTDWVRDWEILKLRYAAARLAATVKIDATRGNLLFDAAHSEAEPEWQLVLHALTLTPGAYQKGDIEDLYIRLVKGMGGRVDESHVPQPTASADADLRAFQKLDAAIKAGEATARAAEEEAKKHLPETSSVLVGAAVVLAVGVLILAVKK